VSDCGTPRQCTLEDVLAIRSAIESGDLPRAIQLRHAIWPPRAQGQHQRFVFIRDCDESDLYVCLHAPMPLFTFCSDEELRELRLRMATAACVSTRPERALIPDSSFPWPHPMSPKAAAQNFYKSTSIHRNVEAWLKSGIVPTVKIANSSDGPCPVCNAAAREYAIRELPQIPLHNCENINTVGCRCSLVATKIIGLSRKW
jgi:hypothetical protein